MSAENQAQQAMPFWKRPIAVVLIILVVITIAASIGDSDSDAPSGESEVTVTATQVEASSGVEDVTQQIFNEKPGMTDQISGAVIDGKLVRVTSVANERDNVAERQAVWTCDAVQGIYPDWNIRVEAGDGSTLAVYFPVDAPGAYVAGQCQPF